MRFRSFTAILLAIIAPFMFIVNPWPLSLIFGSPPIVGGLLCILLLAVSAMLRWSMFPQPRVDVTGKAVFVTGCDSGFGKELSIRLDAMGFQVFAGCLAPDREGAKSLEDASSPNLRIVPIDVTDDFQVMKSVQFVKDNLGDNQLWAVVNNAGVATFCEIEWCSVREFMNIMDINVFGVVRVTKAFLPLLRRSEGRVINVASLAGRYTLPAFSAYSMSKKASIAFSDGLRQEMRKFNISVITIEPGLYKTPILENDILIKRNKKSWAETPTDVKEDYGEEYFDDFLNLISTSIQTAREQTHEVTDNMIDAICSSKPYHRYVPYWRNRLRSFIISNLPTHLADKLFALRFPTKEPSLKKNKSPTKINVLDKIKET